MTSKIEPASPLSTATANGHLMELHAGGQGFCLWRIEVHQVDPAAVSRPMRLEIFRLVTAGSGGLVEGDAGGAIGISLPTTKGDEGILLAVGYLVMGDAPDDDPSEVVGNRGGWVIDFPIPIIVPAGNGVAVKNIDAVAHGSVRPVFHVSESIEP